MKIKQNKNFDLNSKPRKKDFECSQNSKNIQKMILRLLLEAQMSEQDISKFLGITARQLTQASFNKAPQELMQKINLPLIKLYCKTKFINQ